MPEPPLAEQENVTFEPLLAVLGEADAVTVRVFVIVIDIGPEDGQSTVPVP